MKAIISEAFTRTKELLLKHRGHLEKIAKELLEKEIIYQSDLERLIGKRPFETESSYDAFMKKEDNDETSAKKKKDKNQSSENGASDAIDLSKKSEKGEGVSQDVDDFTKPRESLEN